MTAAFNLSQLANKVNTSGQLDLATGISGTIPLANTSTSGVVAGSYTAANVTVDSYGRVTSASSGAANTFTGARGQVFTGSGTFTIPTGISALKITAVGGGGGGGGSNYDNGSCPGTGGSVSVGYLTNLSPGLTLSVTVGGGGGGGSAPYGTGGAGGSTSVSSGSQGITSVVGGGGYGGQWTGPCQSGASASAGALTIAVQNLGSPIFSSGGLYGGGGAGVGGYAAGRPGYQGFCLIEW